MKNEKKSFKYSIYLFVGLFLFFSFIFPIYSVIKNVSWDGFRDLIRQNVFKESLINSLIVTSISTVISVIIAYFLAYILNRTNIKFKKLFAILFTLPIFIPSISHGLGLINLFGKNGILTSLFNIDLNIMGMNGIIFGSVLYSFPVAFLILFDAFKYMNNSMYDCALVLGLNKWQKFKKITLYYLKKPIISVCFATFTLIFTDYGVPLAIGGRFQTLPVFLYREVIGLLDFSKGAMIGIFLLIPAFISFIFDFFNKDRYENTSFTSEYKIKDNLLRDVLAYIFVFLIVSFLFLLFGSFLYLAFVSNFPYDKNFSLIHFSYVLRNGILGYLNNSILISILVALFGTIFAYFTAYVSSRMSKKVGKLFHVIAISSIAIPGIFLGLSYIFAFKNSFIYQTFIILVLVNIIHFFASPYLMAYNALGKLNKNYETVGLTCNINRFRIISDVIIPNTLGTIYEMFSYFFVNSMITISAVSFLFSTEIMPVSLLINQYEGQLMYEESAIVSILILIINLLLKSIIGILKKCCKSR